MRTVTGKHFYGTTLYMPVDTVYKDCVFKKCELIMLHHNTDALITVGPGGYFQEGCSLMYCEIKALDGMFRNVGILVLPGAVNFKIHNDGLQ